MPHRIRDHEKTDAGTGGEPPTAKTGKIYLNPVPRYSGKSNWEQYREICEAIVCSNGWDDVTAALQLLSHLDGDALNVALLVPESQRAMPEFLINSLSDHYNSPGRRAKYKRQFQRVARQPGDDPSIFAIELETLARMASMDVESFPFLPIGWVAERNENTFILGPGPPLSPRSHQTGNDDWSGERGWSPGPAMSTDPNSQ